MDTIVETKNTANDLHVKIQEHLEELAQATDRAKKSEGMLQYLDFCSKFHSYSLGNIWLIMLAKPEATFVAGFHKWKSMGRWVRKGERGIPILAPILVKEENEDSITTQQLVGFKVVYVFDVSQTDGEPLPPPPDWKSPEKNHELNQRLIKYAESLEIAISFKNLPGDIQGVSKGGAIEIDISAGTKTLVHEIAHEIMHKGVHNLQSRAIKELEAESVAFVVCRYFGLDSLNSPNYIAFIDASTEEIYSQMDRIRHTANRIIISIDL
jgi:hypothetical protein